jgi:hypothetical protein
VGTGFSGKDMRIYSIAGWAIRAAAGDHALAAAGPHHCSSALRNSVTQSDTAIEGVPSSGMQQASTADLTAGSRIGT